MNKPPKIFLRFFRWFCHPRLVKPIEGDLMEIYEERVREFGKKKANKKFIKDVLLLFRKDIIRPSEGAYRLNTYGMLKHNIRTSIRHLLRSRFFASINLIGLTTGIVSCLLILTWVKHETSFDSFHQHADRLYRVSCNSGDFHTSLSPGGLAGTLKDQFNFIESTTRLRGPYEVSFKVKNRKFIESEVVMVDELFFQEFSFPFIFGDPKTSLSNPNQLAISLSTAKRYFGESNPIGKSIQKDEDEFIVSGVFQDIPSNSHVRFDIALPSSYGRKEAHYANTGWNYDGWDEFAFRTYFKLFEDKKLTQDELESMNQVLKKATETHLGELNADFNIEAITDIHLHKDLQFDTDRGGSIVFVSALSGIAFLILFMACINYNNLSIMHYLNRMKTFWVQKTIGASSNQIKLYFLSEAFLISFLSLTLASIVTFLCLPYFNRVLQLDLSFSLFSGSTLIAFFLLFLVVGIGGGLYPSLFLSKMTLSKSETQGKERLFSLKNFLMIFQFLISLSLISAGLIMSDQFRMIANKDLGFTKENLIYFQLPEGINRETLTSELANETLIQQFSFSSSLPVNMGQASHGIDWEGKDPDFLPVIPEMEIDHHFFDVFDIELLDGSLFTEKYKRDQPTYIINETAAEVMGFAKGETVGKWIDLVGKGEVIGVIKDFHFKSLYYEIEPLILTQGERSNVLTLKVNHSLLSETINKTEAILKSFDASFQPKLGFVDVELAKLYEAELRLQKIFNLFMILSILISALGLVGLTGYTVNKRLKEIGIRKILGASSISLTYLLTFKYFWLFLIASMLSVPLIIISMTKWLENYSYRIDISAFHFVSSCISCLFLLGLVILFQLGKATNVNPANLLRDE
ncbi:MAG: ABC transporter permease [Bacteroidota bacterium]